MISKHDWKYQFNLKRVMDKATHMNDVSRRLYFIRSAIMECQVRKHVSEWEGTT